MQITVTIPDEFAAQVQARGLTPESYVESLIGDAARKAPKAIPPVEPRMSIDEFIRAMAENSDKLPHLSDEALTRESFYQDHD
jgi:hypothetical protein